MAESFCPIDGIAISDRRKLILCNPSWTVVSEVNWEGSDMRFRVGLTIALAVLAGSGAGGKPTDVLVGK